MVTTVEYKYYNVCSFVCIPAAVSMCLSHSVYDKSQSLLVALKGGVGFPR